MTVVSIKEFEANTSKYLELANKGEKVWIKLKNKITYALTPASEEDLEDELYFTPEMMKKIEKAQKEAEEGKYKIISIEEQKKMFEA